MLFPRLTATLSPFLTPKSCSPLAKALLFRCNSSYVNLCPCALAMTAIRSPYCETIDAKCWGTVCSRSGGYQIPISHDVQSLPSFSVKNKRAKQAVMFQEKLPPPRPHSKPKKNIPHSDQHYKTWKEDSSAAMRQLQLQSAISAPESHETLVSNASYFGIVGGEK